YDNVVKRVRLESSAFRRFGVLLAILVAGAAGNANAVIRSPFPSRPMPPYHGHYMMIGATRSRPGQRPLRRHHHVNFLSGVIPSEVDGPERSTDQIIRSFCNQTNHGRAVFRYRPHRPHEDAGPGRQTEGCYRERSRIASNNWRRSGECWEGASGTYR